MRGWLRKVYDHWFAPAPLEDLALVRIVLVAMQLSLLLIPFFSVQVGACPGCDPEYQAWLTVIDDREFAPLPALKVLLWPFGWGVRPEPMLLQAVWLATVTAGVLALVGLYTRPSLLVLAAGSTLLVSHAYSYHEGHHPEALLTIMLWTLALAPSGARRSLDHLRYRVRHAIASGRFEPEPPGPTLSPHARWPLRLGQWLLVVIYLSAGTSKLLNGGLEWFNGYTLAYYIGDDALERGSALGVWLAQHVLLVQLISIGAIAVELGFGGVLLWPRLVWLFVLAGIGLHVGIYVLQRAPFPQLIALYVVFVGELRQAWQRSPLARRVAARVAGAGGAAKRARWTLVYDGLCPLCRRTMAVLDWMDLRHRLAFVDLEREWPAAARLAPSLSPDQARHAMHLVGPDGTVYRGYAAFARLARLLPALWLVLPLTLLPFADRAGAAAYSLVARQRGRELCRVESCAI
jgi:predicted DCC family thiol-disulfide oxidoreductase YuxK